MTRIDCDLAVLGSGFGGTLTALIAQRLGLTAALLERGVHPRFAIGESSTPLADFKLAAIADRFDLPWLKPFARYGPWKATYPHIPCGLKRGFSFFRHYRGQEHAPGPRNENALLVAASPDDPSADNHWYRPTFDAHLVQQARQAGVAYLDCMEIRDLIHDERGWRLIGHRPEEEVTVRAGFVVDATGDGQMLAQVLGLQSAATGELLSRSRALFAHFTGVAPWHGVLEATHGPAATADHPFPCDAAALHHILDGGWMWVLRFENGITSAGFSLDPEAHPILANESPEAEWRRRLHEYPSLARQFAQAERVEPWVRTSRLQRRLTRAAGDDWALLPHAAGFLDPWLSPGISQTLYAVYRLGEIMDQGWGDRCRPKRLANYGAKVLRELAWVDEITSACFGGFDRFEVLIATSMLYFAAAIHGEEAERAGLAQPDQAFLLCDDDQYRRLAAVIRAQAPTIPADQAAEFRVHVEQTLRPYHGGKLSASAFPHMYPYIP